MTHGSRKQYNVVDHMFWSKKNRKLQELITIREATQIITVLKYSAHSEILEARLNLKFFTSLAHSLLYVF